MSRQGHHSWLSTQRVSSLVPEPPPTFQVPISSLGCKFGGRQRLLAQGTVFQGRTPQGLGDWRERVTAGVRAPPCPWWVHCSAAGRSLAPYAHRGPTAPGVRHCSPCRLPPWVAPPWGPPVLGPLYCLHGQVPWTVNPEAWTRCEGPTILAYRASSCHVPFRNCDVPESSPAQNCLAIAGNAAWWLGGNAASSGRQNWVGTRDRLLLPLPAGGALLGWGQPRTPRLLE